MESTELLLYTVSRIAHVGTAIVVVGGTFFVRCVLLPAATRELSEADHTRLRSAVFSTWRRVVHAGIALFLVTGFINYYRVIAERSHKGDGLYHALLGTKIILALALFFLASALVGRSPALDSFRRNARKWLVVNLLLAGTIVAISGFLKVRGVPDRTGAAAAKSAEMGN